MMLLHAPRRTNYRGPGLGAASQRVPGYSRARCRGRCYRLSLDVVPCFVRKRACAVWRVSRLKAVGEVVGLRAFACRSARWGVAAARAGDVWRARGGGASLRQLLQRGVAFLLCAPPRARKLQRFLRSAGWLVSLVILREWSTLADAGAGSMQAVLSAVAG